MATALYNRYRPRTFSEVVGQSHVTDALGQALRSGRIHHAYLFSGPRGCGKTSSARILAASLNCVNGPTPEPCGVCDQCVAIRAGTSVDVVEIDAASHGSVEDSRDLRDRVAYQPAGGRYRVFVIDEAHMISKEGFGALLKTIEEPPDYAVFIFATTDPDKVLPTIRSRTFHYQFGLVPPKTLEAHLTSVCAAEGVHVEPSVLPLVVRVAEGSVRDSLSVLDQLLAGAADTGLTYAVAVARLGLTDVLLLDDLVDGVATRDAAAVFGVVQRVMEAGQDPRRFTQDVLERFRDLLLLEAVPDAPDRGMLDACPADQLDRMRSQAARLGPAELSRAADVTHAALVDMRGTTTPRMVLELLCARILLPGAATDTGSVLVRLDRLERRVQAAGAGPAVPDRTAPEASAPPRARPIAKGAPAATEAVAVPEAAPATPVAVVDESPDAVTVAPAAEAVIAAPPVAEPEPAVSDLTRLRGSWPQILEAVKAQQGGRTAHALLTPHAEVASVEGRTVTVSFANPSLGRTFSTNGVHVEKLVEALAERMGGSWRVVVGGPPPAPRTVPGSPPPPPTPAGFAPGDEPEPDDDDSDDDEAVGDEGPPRLRGEELAMGLLKEHMGATLVGELDNV